jgi:hypothetical protein
MSVRQQRRAANQAARLQEKVRRSRGPADEAAITWDKVRAAIAGDRDQVDQPATRGLPDGDPVW